MGVDEKAETTMSAWPFAKKAFVWAIGPSGMAVADVLAGFSIPVIVFQSGNEETGEPGGEAAEADGLVSVVRGEEILKIDGHFGQFRIRVRKKDGSVTEWEAGLVLIVRGNQSPETKGNGISLPETNILTTDALEALASSGGGNGVPDSLGVWLDPGEGLPDRVPAERALRAVLRMKTNGKPDCFVLARHVPLWGLEGQSLYDDLREKGVRFLRLGAERPSLKAADGRVEIEVQDRTISDQAVRLQVDRLLVVGQPSPPPGAGEIAKCVGDPLDIEGFLQKDNAHLYPSRSFRKGIYYVGPCKGEQAEEELVEEVGAIVPEILAPIASGETKVPEGIRIDSGHCVSCLTCYRVCPHHALDISRGPTPVPVDPACYGCGLCAACARETRSNSHGGRENRSSASWKTRAQARKTPLTPSCSVAVARVSVRRATEVRMLCRIRIKRPLSKSPAPARSVKRCSWRPFSRGRKRLLSLAVIPTTVCPRGAQRWVRNAPSGWPGTWLPRGGIPGTPFDSLRRHRTRHIGCLTS